MAEYPIYTIDDVAEFSGRDDIGEFITQALKQATLLFKIGTCLSAFPDNELEAELAMNGILSMADAIESVQKYQRVLYSPFSSETIGSYSYSKLSTAVSAGLPTGVSWFDIAIGKLSVCDQDGVPMHGGWLVHEENKAPNGGYGVYLGPADQHPDGWGTDTFDPPES